MALAVPSRNPRVPSLLWPLLLNSPPTQLTSSQYPCLGSFYSMSTIPTRSTPLLFPRPTSKHTPRPRPRGNCHQSHMLISPIPLFGTLRCQFSAHPTVSPRPNRSILSTFHRPSQSSLRPTYLRNCTCTYSNHFFSELDAHFHGLLQLGVSVGIHQYSIHTDGGGKGLLLLCQQVLSTAPVRPRD
ncbi:hypothetical protein EDB84DRAFT_367224 [Lactarius hengduanensis]|nr:hypothetical protein EDB84DRAFT_367224 [Lactarius hengduanensis]